MIRSSWCRHRVSWSQTGSGRNTSDCLQHLFTTWQADPATQHQSRTPVLDYHGRLQQPLIKLGFEHLSNKDEEVENWITKNRLILISKPDDPNTFHSRTWKTTSTPDLAIATEDIKGITERGVSSQLGSSDHRPMIISIKGQIQSIRNKLPASWNYKKKANWDAFREAVDRKTAALELPETNISNSVALFNKAVFEAERCSFQRKTPRLSSLLDSRAWQPAQDQSKREDRKLANKRKYWGTQ